MEFMNRNKLDYEIVKLKHAGKTFQEIGNQYKLCGAGIAHKYRKFLFRLFKCCLLYTSIFIITKRSIDYEHLCIWRFCSKRGGF